MNRLGDRNYLLITQAMQSAEPDDYRNADALLAYSFEQFYTHEYTQVRDFVQWMLDGRRTIGHGNYEIVFGDWLRSQGQAPAIDVIPAGLAPLASPSWVLHTQHCLDLIDYAGPDGKAQGRAELLRLAALIDKANQEATP